VHIHADVDIGHGLVLRVVWATVGLSRVALASGNLRELTHVFAGGQPSNNF